ncbi:TPA: hypothetical protein I7288_23510 [Vibrio parahaemolyticus]|nr:hypothetical protein [Vibrio parahaemolyticus]
MSVSTHKDSVGKAVINSKSKPWVWQLTKHSRGIHNAWQFWFELALVFTAQWFRLGGLRCSPLNAALCLLVFQCLKNFSISVLCPFGNSSELPQQIRIVVSSS